MTNAEKLIQGLAIVGTNVNHEPLVVLKQDPTLGEFIIRQGDLSLSLGEPCLETQLFDAKSGKRVFTARDEEKFAVAQAAFSAFEYKCNNKAIDNAKVKAKAVMDVLGFLGC